MQSCVLAQGSIVRTSGIARVAAREPRSVFLCVFVAFARVVQGRLLLYSY